MYCRYCGASMAAEETICHVCGKPTTVSNAVTNRIPEENQPLSPWTYFWLQVLYSIPIVGFIFLIIFSIKGDNINRRNFTRSYWCSLILCLILFLIIFILVAVLGMGSYMDHLIGRMH